MADFVLRPAGREDFPSIRALIRDTRINPTGLDWHRFVVAVTPSGVLLGCGQIKPHRDGVLELASLAVQPQARGQGIARAIVLHLLEKEPSRPLFLTCRSRLGRLYRKFGFTPVSQEHLPPYFRLLSWLGNLFRGILDEQNRLLIMRLEK
ncbi:MAG: GNAT family N-acetyltransferase [Anaerolineales bacterium]|nr:GNAT family N-acetyltransferase [Anaerolineales bacterium]